MKCKNIEHLISNLTKCRFLRQINKYENKIIFNQSSEKLYIIIINQLCFIYFKQLYKAQMKIFL